MSIYKGIHEYTQVYIHEYTQVYIHEYTQSRYKTWTLDSGLDCRLDYGLNYGHDFRLDFRLESKIYTHISRPSHCPLFDHLQSCAKGCDYTDSYGYMLA